MGEHNVSVPGEADIVDSDFNGWADRKRMVLVHEIYAEHSRKAYDKLKPLTADRFLTINLKHMQPYVIDNWTHVFACFNSFAPMGPIPTVVSPAAI